MARIEKLIEEINRIDAKKIEIDRERREAKIQLLSELVEVARKTTGSEVWRMLFAEAIGSLKRELEKRDGGGECTS